MAYVRLAPNKIMNHNIGMMAANEEEWRSIRGLEGYYEVSSLGRVRSMNRIAVRIDGIQLTYRGRILKAIPNARGYWTVWPTKNRKKITKRVHFLVAEAFLGPRPDGMEACHKDDDKSRNIPSNLYYTTHQQNVADRGSNGHTARGIQHGKAKLTDDDIRQIRSLKGHISGRRIGNLYGVSHTNIQDIQSRKTWAHI